MIPLIILGCLGIAAVVWSKKSEKQQAKGSTDESFEAWVQRGNHVLDRLEKPGNVQANLDVAGTAQAAGTRDIDLLIQRLQKIRNGHSMDASNQTEEVTTQPMVRDSDE